jgi:hypothetical protein
LAARRGWSRCVFLAGEDHQRGALGLVLHGGVVDRHLLAVVECHAALAAGIIRFLMRTLAKVPRHHHLMVAAPGAVAVEVLLGHAVLDQVTCRGAAGLIPPAGEMWSVVTESPKMASARAPRTAGLGAAAEAKKGGSWM